MPRVNMKTKSARGRERTCGRCGATIAPGEKYYYWDFRYGGTNFRCHLHYPRQSELTQSKMSAIYAAQEDAAESMPSTSTMEEISGILESVGAAAEEVMQEYADAAEAMGAAGEEMQYKADELESWHGELEGWEPPEEPEEIDEDDVRAWAEQRYVYGELPPDAQERYAGPEGLPSDPIELHNLMLEFDMDRGESLEGFVEQAVQEATEDEGDTLEEARASAMEVIDGCPL